MATMKVDVAAPHRQALCFFPFSLRARDYPTLLLAQVPAPPSCNVTDSLHPRCFLRVCSFAPH
jgi:hypothetical protein